jgi:uncharacterized protein YqiB (DUF1249 family)
VTRGKQAVRAYTDDIEQLRRSVQKADEHVSAIDLAELHQQQRRADRRARLMKHLGQWRRFTSLHGPAERHGVDRQHEAHLHRKAAHGR